MIENRLIYNTKYYDAKATCNNLEQNIKTITKELEEKNKNLTDHLNALEILHLLRSKKINEKRKLIIDMLTTGCQDIFQKNYRIDILSSDEEDKTKSKEIKYNIILYKNDIEVARNEKLIMSSGGGVLSVFSFLLKVIINLIYTKEKFFIFDESMTQVSKEYQPRLSNFLHELCKKQEITLVLITHMELIKMYADNSYHLIGSFDTDNETPVLEIEEKTKISTYPFYRLHLENFQSIKNLTFDFAGFTVVTGENDIGKSTITRSLNSILYNDFDSIYIRRNIKRGEKCIIEFSKFIDKNKTAFNMKLEAGKSSGVTYSVNGEEFRGKKLSKEAIEKELEKNGFGSFITPDALSSFKGEKKKKIANLVVTTQNDHLYLLDNSSSENNKIISYIFQASTINEAILKLKEKINEIKNENKLIEKNLISLKERYTEILKEKEIFYKKYFIELLRLLKDINYKKVEIVNKEQNLRKISKNYQNLILFIEYKIQKTNLFKISKYNEVFIKEKHNLENKLKYIEDKIETLKKYQQLKNYVKLISNLDSLNNDINNKKKLFLDIKNKLENLENKIIKFKELKEISFYINKYQNNIKLLDNINNNLKIYKTKIKDIDKQIIELDKNIDKLKEKKEKIAEKKVYVISLKEISNEYFEKKKRLEFVNEKYLKLKKEKENIEKELKEFVKNHICPTCKGTGYHIH